MDNDRTTIQAIAETLKRYQGEYQHLIIDPRDGFHQWLQTHAGGCSQHFHTGVITTSYPANT